METLKQLQPDILIIGLGSPKQELWMLDHRRELDIPVIWGAGGTLDYAANSIPRAPFWMHKLGLEWLGRMLIEPGRLIPRYAFGIPRFLIRSFQHAIAFHLKQVSR